MENFLVTGIGASAGGIQVLKEFFEAVPARSGIAYVVILHLSPDHDSQLAAVLQDSTALPVIQVKEKTYLKPDHVYVIPPDKHLTMEDGYVLVTPNTDLAERRAPIDIFFRSLAESHDSRAVGVILCGTGANGSMGLKRIKERGGAVFVQNPREAEFNEMPRNAIATNMVDEVLNVEAIPAKIITYRDSLGTLHIPEAPKDQEEEDQQALRTILTELRLRTGHDFANYKRPTLLRRIARRVHVRDLPGLPAYAAFILQHPEETQALLKDLLISVTNFFRDTKPFDELERNILPKILEAKTSLDQLRIWVAGCATGEEAYSIAMICADLTLGMVDVPKVQIFATDIDETAIAVARDGYYTLNDAADISQQRLDRYFTKEGSGYRVRREIRETILFANHNFIKDSPFSRIDIVSCRNVLIYLNRAAQERVFETFHFALRMGGFLMLGASESVDGASDLFTVYSREQHIWQSRQVATKTIIVPEGIPRMEFPQPVRTTDRQRSKERISFGELHQQMVELYAPPSLVVNEEFDIMHTSEHAARYLTFVAGEPTQNLLKTVRQELRADLRSALYQAIQSKTSVSVMGLNLSMDNHTEALNIHVRPVPDSNTATSGFMLVVFEPAAGDVGEMGVVLSTDEPASRHLEEEVARLKAQLRSSNEQHEFAAEELKAGNEELQAMNEELRSATEELETSKEELQSINEELSTVNQELKVKIEEATMVSNNLQNLINSTDIGTIFLDRSFRVVLFTPAARSIYNLIPADYGRPLSDITSRLEANTLLEEAQTVLEQLQRIEREARTVDGRTLLVRMAPYRTEEDSIKGVVISLLDITERKQSEDKVRMAEEQQSFLVQLGDIARNLSSPADLEEAFTAAAISKFSSDRCYYCEITEDLAIIRRDASVAGLPSVAGTYELEKFPILRAAILSGKPIIVEDVHTTELVDEEVRQLCIQLQVISFLNIPVIKDGKCVGELCIVQSTPRKWTDIEVQLAVEVAERTWAAVERARAQEALRESGMRLHLTLETAVDYAIINMDEAGLIEDWSRGAELTFGWTEAEILGQSADIIFTPEDRAAGAPDKERAIAIKEGSAPDERWHIRKDGTRFYVSGVMRPVYDAGKLRGFLKVARDLTQKKESEENLRVSEERYRTALQSADMAAWDWDIISDTVIWNDQHYTILGLQPDGQAKSAGFFLSFVHPDDADRITSELRNAVETGTYCAEFRVIRSDNGQVRWMSGYGRAVGQNDKNHITRMVGVMYDITERKRLEHQKEQFIGVASHELRTPVTSIKTYAEILEEMFLEKGDHSSAELIHKIDVQVDRLIALIYDLLDTTRISGDRLELHKSEFMIDELIAETAESMERLTQGQQIILQLQAATTVLADRERIRQVLVNLVGNAIKYAPGTDRIIISSEADQAEVKISVKDFGRGISEQEQEKIFEQFFQSRDSNDGTGLGLGLFISSGIVHQHGGSIKVESTPGEGSTFSFTIPIREA